MLESADAAVSILSLGCIVRDWRIDGPAGSLPVVLGFRGSTTTSATPARTARSSGGWRTAPAGARFASTAELR